MQIHYNSTEELTWFANVIKDAVMCHLKMEDKAPTVRVTVHKIGTLGKLWMKMMMSKKGFDPTKELVISVYDDDTEEYGI